MDEWNRKEVSEKASLRFLNPSLQSSKDVKLKSINIMCGEGGEKKVSKNKNLANTLGLKNAHSATFWTVIKLLTDSLFKL